MRPQQHSNICAEIKLHTGGPYLGIANQKLFAHYHLREHIICAFRHPDKVDKNSIPRSQAFTLADIGRHWHG